MNSAERRRLKERKRHLRRQRKKYIAEQKRSIKKQRHENRGKKARMGKIIRKAKWNDFVKSFIYFIKHPVGIEKASQAQLIVRKHVKEDIKKIRRKKMEQLPGEIAGNINRFWKIRYFRFRNIIEEISNFLKSLHSIHTDKQLRRSYLIGFANSTVLFILSFFFVYFLNQFVTVWVAKIFDIPAILYSYRIYWPLYTYSTLYSRGALIVIFGAGPLICLILGFVFFRLWVLTRKNSGNLKIFALWTAFHAFNLFFGAYIVGVITRTGFIYTTEWLFLSRVFDVEEIVFLITSVIFLLIIGYYGTRHYLNTANSVVLIEPKFRFVYMLAVVFIPWLVGNLVIFFLNYPHKQTDLLLLQVTTVLMIFPMFFRYQSPSLQINRHEKGPLNIRVGWIYFFLLIVALIFIRIVIFRGIKFS